MKQKDIEAYRPKETKPQPTWREKANNAAFDKDYMDKLNLLGIIEEQLSSLDSSPNPSMGNSQGSPRVS